MARSSESERAADLNLPRPERVLVLADRAASKNAKRNRRSVHVRRTCGLLARDDTAGFQQRYGLIDGVALNRLAFGRRRDRTEQERRDHEFRSTRCDPQMPRHHLRIDDWLRMRGRDRNLRVAHRFDLETFGHRRRQSPAGERHLMGGLGTGNMDITVAMTPWEVFLAANSRCAGTLTNATSEILIFISIPLRATRVALEQPSCLRRSGLRRVVCERNHSLPPSPPPPVAMGS